MAAALVAMHFWAIAELGDDLRFPLGLGLGEGEVYFIACTH